MNHHFSFEEGQIRKYFQALGEQEFCHPKLYFVGIEDCVFYSLTYSFCIVILFKMSNEINNTRPKVSSSNILLIIDPQVDFHPGGSLAIPTANEDSERLASFVMNNLDYIDEIWITLDSHHRMHIAHGVFWTNDKGQHPTPFSVVTYDDIKKGLWRPVKKGFLDKCLDYTKKLEEKGRFQLVIWPEHCLIGTYGHSVVPALNSAIQEWTFRRQKPINYHCKGMNCLTEMYSALIAEVEMPDDPTTSLDAHFMDSLLKADKLLIGGQALSHCVQFSTRDILANWRGKDPSQIVLLTDGTSPVPCFEAAANKFVSDMTAAGLTISTTKDMRLAPTSECNSSTGPESSSG